VLCCATLNKRRQQEKRKFAKYFYLCTIVPVRDMTAETIKGSMSSRKPTGEKAVAAPALNQRRKKTPKDCFVHGRVDAPLRKRLDAYLERADIKEADALRWAVRQYLDREDAKEKAASEGGEERVVDLKGGRGPG
jgi:hypothetical protein